MKPAQLGILIRQLYALSYIKGYSNVLLQLCYMVIGKLFPIKQLFLPSLWWVVLDYLHNFR